MAQVLEPGSATPSPLWHVTLTVAGRAVSGADVRSALERLAHERPFLHAGRYAVDRAEVRYWEEAPTLLDTVSLALRLWPEHRRTAHLPSWDVVGLEVLDRDTYHHRHEHLGGWPALAGRSEIRPF